MEKRGLHPYDDKRYLLDNLEDGSPNPNSHAYGHYSIPATDTLLDSPDAGQGLVISVPPPRDSIDKCKDRRYKKRHKRVEKQLTALEMAENKDELAFGGDCNHDSVY